MYCISSIYLQFIRTSPNADRYFAYSTTITIRMYLHNINVYTWICAHALQLTRLSTSVLARTPCWSITASEMLYVTDRPINPASTAIILNYTRKGVH